jgi:hypothetical protein
MTRPAGRHGLPLSGTITDLEVTAKAQVQGRVEPFVQDAAQQRIELRCGRVRDLLETENTGGKNQ